MDDGRTWPVSPLCQQVSLEGTDKDIWYLLPVVAGFWGRAEVSLALVGLDVAVR